MGPRGAGRRLNDQERMEILDILAREAKVKNVDLAKRYGVSEGAIRKLKQVKDRIRDRYYLGNEHNRDKRKRGGFARNAQFEQELYQWICRMREAQAYQLLPLTQTAVRQQAMLLAQKYERMGTFKASPGWFARFCSRHRLDPPMTSSTAGAPPAPAAAAVASSEEAKATDAAAVAAAVFRLPALPDADALMVEVKPDAEAETIDEQTKLAARQHNIVALGIAKAASAAAVASASTTAVEVTAAAVVAAAAASEAVDESKPVESETSTMDVDSEEKAPASSVATTTATTTTAAVVISATTADVASTTTTVDVVSATAAAAAAPSTEDEIFSLGL